MERVALIRTFPAPRERVFELFADAALLAEWWGPRGFSIPRIDFEPRAGATYRIEETLARLSFEAIGDSTRIVLAQGPFKTDARRELHRDGWGESFDRLGELVARRH
jgi:uncharacterized protein YndB with AHSA1/START domain